MLNVETVTEAELYQFDSVWNIPSWFRVTLVNLRNNIHACMQALIVFSEILMRTWLNVLEKKNSDKTTLIHKFYNAWFCFHFKWEKI